MEAEHCLNYTNIGYACDCILELFDELENSDLNAKHTLSATEEITQLDGGLPRDCNRPRLSEVAMRFDRSFDENVQYGNSQLTAEN
ncbi:Oidioi.mRNA.OKI2018_I69.XSR.g14991.t1.cds [Oikopleura dioica]|uniref:Oidioi.mRNA.OKI2018_I69.XSR.g14991.t1.cds n=1 Tax=Oikopleura dioica TaxID=34765 RepID=A0ABN7SKH1_OIKDI|nr:Oidioi.mRNA.OKI2018_I69.XSR.g14991.t1.cds [Oikopleura dioica]